MFSFLVFSPNFLLIFNIVLASVENVKVEIILVIAVCNISGDSKIQKRITYTNDNNSKNNKKATLQTHWLLLGQNHLKRKSQIAGQSANHKITDEFA